MIWEYTLVRIQGADDITGLTRLGEEGWEAFAAVPFTTQTGVVVFLKRPKG